MFVANKEALKSAIFEDWGCKQVDENGNPIFKGDGKGVDMSKLTHI